MRGRKSQLRKSALRTLPDVLLSWLKHFSRLAPSDSTSASWLLSPSDSNSNAATRLLQHSFPHDFRSGPALLDWDPSKWAIVLLQYLGLASGLRRARVEDISAAREHMLHKEIALAYSTDSTTDLEEQDDGWSGETWTKERLAEYAGAKGRCVLLLRGYVVDVTDYMTEHVRVCVRHLPRPEVSRNGADMSAMLIARRS